MNIPEVAGPVGAPVDRLLSDEALRALYAFATGASVGAVKLAWARESSNGHRWSIRAAVWAEASPFHPLIESEGDLTLEGRRRSLGQVLVDAARRVRPPRTRYEREVP